LRAEPVGIRSLMLLPTHLSSLEQSDKINGW
jgi:hypothetical protein